MNKKSSINRWFMGIVVLVILGIGGWWFVSQKSSPQTKRVAARTTHSKVVAKKESKHKVTTTTKLDSENLTPGETVLEIAYYASHNFSRDDGWQSVYDDLSSGTLKVLLSSKRKVELVKPGIGVQYVLVKNQEQTSNAAVRKAPSYTLENDKTVNYYRPYDYDETIQRASLSDIVAYSNAAGMGSKIKQLATNVTITDARQSEQSANDLTEEDFADDAGYILEKALVFYGTQRGTGVWQGVKKDIAKGKVRIHLQISGSPSELVYDQSGAPGALIFYEAASVGHPDLYNFGHITGSGEDDYEMGDTGNTNVGYTLKELLPYINAHGGRAAVEKMPVIK